MDIEVVMRETTMHINLPEPVTGTDVLKQLNLLPDTVIILVDGKPIPYTEEIKTSCIRIIQVASGG